MQGVTRNPLADPGILGINTGASLAVVVGIAGFGLTAASSYIWVAILGAALTAVLVYVLGSLGQGGATPLKLALAGAAPARPELVHRRRGPPPPDIGDSVLLADRRRRFLRPLQQVAVPATSAVLCLLSARGLNTLALGDELAARLGGRVSHPGAGLLGAVVLWGQRPP